MTSTPTSTGYTPLSRSDDGSWPTIPDVPDRGPGQLTTPSRPVSITSGNNPSNHLHNPSAAVAAQQQLARDRPRRRTGL